MPSSVADRVRQTAERRAAGRDIGPVGDCENPERRARRGKSLLAFCEYFPQRFTLEFSADHVKAIGLLQAAIIDGGQFAVAGHGDQHRVRAGEGERLVGDEPEHPRRVGAAQQFGADVADTFQLDRAMQRRAVIGAPPAATVSNWDQPAASAPSRGSSSSSPGTRSR